MDDRAAATGRDHAAGHLLRGEERRPEIEAHHRVEVVLADLGERLGAVHPGIVDEDVEGWPPGQCARHVIGAGHVEWQGLGHLATGPDGGGSFLDLAGRARAEGHVCAGIGQRRCHGEAKSAARARDKGPFSVKAERGRWGEGEGRVHRSDLWPAVSIALTPPPSRRGRSCGHSA